MFMIFLSPLESVICTWHIYIGIAQSLILQLMIDGSESANNSIWTANNIIPSFPGCGKSQNFY